MKKDVTLILRMIGSTSGARFIASHRLFARDRFNNGITVFSSAFLIILSIVNTTLSPESAPKQIIDVVSVALAVLILAFSAFQYAGNHAINGELMHRCALEINEIRRNLESQIGEISQAQLDEALEKYSAILSRYPINHLQRDFRAYRFRNHWKYEDLNSDLRNEQGEPYARVTPQQASWNRMILRAQVFWDHARVYLVALALLAGVAVAASLYITPAVEGQTKSTQGP